MIGHNIFPFRFYESKITIVTDAVLLYIFTQRKEEIKESRINDIFLTFTDDW